MNDMPGDKDELDEYVERALDESPGFRTAYEKLQRREAVLANLTGWYYLFREHTTCRIGWHCGARKRIKRFNGGNVCWTCCYCERIHHYGLFNR